MNNLPAETPVQGVPASTEQVGTPLKTSRRREAGKTTRLFQRAKQCADEGACVVVVMGSRREADRWRLLVAPEIKIVKLDEFSDRNIKIPRDGSPLTIGCYTYFFDHDVLELLALYDQLSADFLTGVSKPIYTGEDLTGLRETPGRCPG